MNSPRETSPPAETNREKPLRVLCAEDDDQIALILKFALERAGHEVERVADGQQALERITSDVHFFDLLVTDHQMPRLSGRGLVEKLRDTAFAGKIIVHSSHLRPADAAAYRALAVDYILSKPVQLAEFLAAVQQTGAPAP